MTKTRVCISIDSETFQQIKEKYIRMLEFTHNYPNLDNSYLNVDCLSQFIERALINEMNRLK